jgi:hypothetical protein
MIKKITLLAFCFLFVFTLSACRRQLALPDQENQQVNMATQQNQQQPTYTPEELKNNYQQSLRTELNAFLQSGNAQVAKENILELRTPVDYLQLHLDMVLAFEDIQSGDDQKAQEGRAKIEVLRQQNDWLR